MNENKLGKPLDPVSFETMDLPWAGDTLKRLLEGSHFHKEPWNDRDAWSAWEKERKFIAKCIHKDGSLLDYGSANGFLLKCLQKWSSHTIDPYGVDVGEQAIADARTLFPQQQNHFAAPQELKDGKDFPNTFDFVYWNVWDNFDFEMKGAMDLVKKMYDAVLPGGRLILGFYDPEKETALGKIEQLKGSGFVPTEIVHNPDGKEILAVFQKEMPKPSVKEVSEPSVSETQ